MQLNFRLPCRWMFAVLCFGILIQSSAYAQETKQAKESVSPLSYVPADSLVFVHIPIADVWKSPIFKAMRETFQDAGKDIIDSIEKRFNPSLSSLDTLDLFVTGGLENLKEPTPIVVLHLSKSIDSKAFMKAYFSKAVASKMGEREVWVEKGIDTAFYFADSQTIIFSEPKVLKNYLGMEVPTRGPLAKAIKSCMGSKDIQVFGNLEIIPNQLLAILGPFASIAAANQVHLQIGFEKDLTIKLELKYATVKAREKASEAIQQGIVMGKQYITDAKNKMRDDILKSKDQKDKLEQMFPVYAQAYALGAMNKLEKYLENPPIKSSEDTISILVTVPAIYMELMGNYSSAIGMLLPGVQSVRGNAAKMQSANNLKQLQLACMNYESAYGHLPPAAICDKNGKPLLSWRVAILPYIEQGNLYNQFKLDEPWDSEHNKKLSQMIVKAYVIPGQNNKTLNLTHYRIFTGKSAAFDLVKGRRMVDFTDGTSNTIAIVEAAEGAIWTKPEEFEYDPKKPLPKMGSFFDGGFQAAFVDGSIHFFKTDIAEKTLRALITRNGGEVITDK